MKSTALQNNVQHPICHKDAQATCFQGRTNLKADEFMVVIQCIIIKQLTSRSAFTSEVFRTLADRLEKARFVGTRTV